MITDTEDTSAGNQRGPFFSFLCNKGDTKSLDAQPSETTRCATIARCGQRRCGWCGCNSTAVDGEFIER